MMATKPPTRIHCRCTFLLLRKSSFIAGKITICLPICAINASFPLLQSTKSIVGFYHVYIYIYQVFSKIVGCDIKDGKLGWDINGIALWPISVALYPCYFTQPWTITHSSSVIYLLNMVCARGYFQYPGRRFIPEISAKLQ